jgi:triosephosphate isomerase
MAAQARRPLTVGNWKMNLSEIWAARLAEELTDALAGLDGVETAVAPAFPCLRAVADRLDGSSVALAAQNVHWEEKGAFTGEVAPRMLSEMGVRFVIVGHSERRAIFGETDERIQRKAAAARAHDIVPILCVGEREEERDEGKTLAVVERQVRLGLGGIREAAGSELVVAYEPVWAIGTGRTPTPDQVNEVHRMIREQLAAMYGPQASERIRILYGGSVNADNASELLALPEVDGGLVGGASLEAEGFAAIARASTP